MAAAFFFVTRKIQPKRPGGWPTQAWLWLESACSSTSGGLPNRRIFSNTTTWESGCTTALDYTEQISWLLFLKYLDNWGKEKAYESGPLLIFRPVSGLPNS